MNHPNRNWRRRLTDAAIALGPDLVHAWQAVTLSRVRRASQHATLTEALSLLNVATGGNYTLSRLGEWRNGRRPVPPEVERHMRRIVLGHLLEDLRTAAAVARVMDHPQTCHSVQVAPNGK